MTTLDAEYQVLPASPPCPFSACPNSSIPVGSRPLVGTIALCSLRVLDDTCPKRDDFRLDETGNEKMALSNGRDVHVGCVTLHGAISLFVSFRNSVLCKPQE